MKCTLAALSARGILIALIFLSGCTALETRESQAWLALHAIDTAQTFRIAHDPKCFKEQDGITRRLIGTHPSDGEVAAWAVGSAALHLGVTELLLRNDHPKIAKAWQYIRIGTAASAIAENWSLGIRLGSPNKPSARSCIAEPPPFDPKAQPIK